MIPTSFRVLLVLLATTMTTLAETPKLRVVLVGDSTVASKSGWGDAFGKLLAADTECFNRGVGGSSTKSFRTIGAWDKAIALKPAWVLIQFGHNDQPGKGPERETDPNTTYAENLGRYVDEARAAGAQPVLITSLTRRTFEAGHIVSTLTPYAEAAKKVAAEKHVPLVDLHTRSIEQAEKLGPEGITQMEPPGKEPGTSDHTHLNSRGGELVAPLVADELRKVAPDLAAHLAEKK